MLQNRLIFLVVWLTGLVALFVMPGVEPSRLIAGSIIGAWPLLVWEPSWGHAALVLSVLVVLSGLEVGLCGWAMDRAKLKAAWVVLLIAVIAGAVVGYARSHGGYERWERSPSVSAAVEANVYEPTRRDFQMQVVAPAVLVSGLWGLYVAAAFCAVCSIGQRATAPAPTQRLRDAPERAPASLRSASAHSASSPDSGGVGSTL